MLFSKCIFNQRAGTHPSDSPTQPTRIVPIPMAQTVLEQAPPAYSITDPVPALRRKLTKSHKNPYLSYVNKPTSESLASACDRNGTGRKMIKGPAVLVIDVGDEAMVEIMKTSSPLARWVSFGLQWMRVGGGDAIAVAGRAASRVGVC